MPWDFFRYPEISRDIHRYLEMRYIRKKFQEIPINTTAKGVKDIGSSNLDEPKFDD